MLQPHKDNQLQGKKKKRKEGREKRKKEKDIIKPFLSKTSLSFLLCEIFPSSREAPHFLAFSTTLLQESPKMPKTTISCMMLSTNFSYDPLHQSRKITKRAHFTHFPHPLSTFNTPRFSYLPSPIFPNNSYKTKPKITSFSKSDFSRSISNTDIQDERFHKLLQNRIGFFLEALLQSRPPIEESLIQQEKQYSLQLKNFKNGRKTAEIASTHFRFFIKTAQETSNMAQKSLNWKFR